LAHCLTGHFTTPATRHYGRAGLDPPNRLVFLLDHEYTQRGLNWNRLKGADAERAALLRAVAERAGCEAVLALAEVKETWDAGPSDGEAWDDYGHYDEEDEDEDEEDYGGVSRDRGSDNLEPFRVETVTPEHASGLAAAAGQYGEQWTRGVIAGWFGPGHYLETDRYEWVDRLPGPADARRAAGLDVVARECGSGSG
jgi:hypothetical protein